MTDNTLIVETELSGTAPIVAAKTEEGHPRHYRLGRRNGELVLQGAFYWQRGFRESGHEWRDIPIIDLDGEQP